jgi:transposase
VEVVTRGERRRTWSEEDKVRIVQEAMVPGAVAADVARRWGVGTGQLYTWRRELLDRTARAAATTAIPAPSFAQVMLAEPAVAPPSPLAPSRAGLIEIVLPGGAVVMVDAAVDGDALRRVLSALATR